MTLQSHERVRTLAPIKLDLPPTQVEHLVQHGYSSVHQRQNEANDDDHERQRSATRRAAQHDRRGYFFAAEPLKDARAYADEEGEDRPNSQPNPGEPPRSAVTRRLGFIRRLRSSGGLGRSTGRLRSARRLRHGTPIS